MEATVLGLDAMIGNYYKMEDKIKKLIMYGGFLIIITIIILFSLSLLKTKNNKQFTNTDIEEENLSTDEYGRILDYEDNFNSSIDGEFDVKYAVEIEEEKSEARKYCNAVIGRDETKCEELMNHIKSNGCKDTLKFIEAKETSNLSLCNNLTREGFPRVICRSSIKKDINYCELLEEGVEECKNILSYLFGDIDRSALLKRGNFEEFLNDPYLDYYRAILLDDITYCDGLPPLEPPYQEIEFERTPLMCKSLFGIDTCDQI